VQISSFRDALLKCGLYRVQTIEGLTPIPDLLKDTGGRSFFAKIVNPPVEPIIIEKKDQVFQIKKKSDSHLKFKVVTCEGKKMHKCDFCGQLKVTLSAIEGHLQKEHYQKQPLSCPNCHYKTYNKACYNEHTQRNFCKKNLQCNYCNFSAIRKGDLMRHERKHKPPQFLCSCGKKFVQEWSLRIHKRTQKCT
jgi:KRAB domain-containing zinc finger protein